MGNKSVLIVAAHVPPYRSGSGYLRVLKFCDYLPSLGWDPIVLAPSNTAFTEKELNLDTTDLLRCPTTRAFALDSARHLSIRGRYPDILAVPDRWCTWWLPAVFAGMRLIRKHQPAAIFSTYPIATTHLIGWSLAKLTGVPWVADFRDPMIDDHYPPPGIARRARAAIERGAMGRSAASIFTTASTREFYRGRFPDVPDHRMHLVMNGYDENDFLAANESHSDTPGESPSRSSGPLLLLHSGLLYPDVRDPSDLFRALSELKQENVLSSEELRVRLRACGPEDRYRKTISDYDIDDLVEIMPGVPYHEALAEMQTVDGLLLLQGAEANKQVPAKLFEYFRAGTPIMALVDAAGDTARILRDAGVGTIVPIDGVAEIKAALRDFVHDEAARRSWASPLEVATRYSREASAKGLAKVLDQVVSSP